MVRYDEGMSNSQPHACQKDGSSAHLFLLKCSPCMMRHGMIAEMFGTLRNKQALNTTPPSGLPAVSCRHSIGRCWTLYIFARRSRRCTRPQAILVTAGEKGAAYTIGGHTGFIPVFKSIEVVETTGAGDAFSAGFISEAIKFLSAKHKGDVGESSSSPSSALDEIGMAAGGEGEGGAARDMVRFASAVGALTCCGDGAIKPQPLHGDVRGLLAAEGASSPASAAAASAAATTQS